MDDRRCNKKCTAHAARPRASRRDVIRARVRARTTSLAPTRRPDAMTPPELDGVTDKDRFELELEFVSALANPRYVHHLAKEGFLRDSRFVAFLRHLSYWERPEYAKFILYPHALRFRRELEREEFRRAMENPRNAERVFAAQYAFWASRSANASSSANAATT